MKLLIPNSKRGFMLFLEKLNQLHNDGIITTSLYEIILELFESYNKAISNYELTQEKKNEIFLELLESIEEDIRNPFVFATFHKKVLFPKDYSKFGRKFLFPLLDLKNSFVIHSEKLKEISNLIAQNYNVIFLANHQTEIDPQLIDIAFGDMLGFSHLSQNMIFVAGDRVITDPLSRPFSMGCDLLCIYSKRHINHPIEKKEEKLRHNQKTMRLMKNLLSKGGCCIYVAPSGGRDRRNKEGLLLPSPFDPDSIEMFRIISKASQKPTFFYPMALQTFDLLPPPEIIEVDLGEIRKIYRSSINFSIGNAIDLEKICTENSTFDKLAQREIRANFVYNVVLSLYQEIEKRKN